VIEEDNSPKKCQHKGKETCYKCKMSPWGRMTNRERNAKKRRDRDDD
jgi:hypothetical protein